MTTSVAMYSPINIYCAKRMFSPLFVILYKSENMYTKPAG